MAVPLPLDVGGRNRNVLAPRRKPPNFPSLFTEATPTNQLLPSWAHTGSPRELPGSTSLHSLYGRAWEEERERSVLGVRRGCFWTRRLSPGPQ